MQTEPKDYENIIVDEIQLHIQNGYELRSCDPFRGPFFNKDTHARMDIREGIGDGFSSRLIDSPFRYPPPRYSPFECSSTVTRQ